LAHVASEIRRLVQLALPLLLGQLASTSMGFVDTVMAGRISATDLAAVSIGTSFLLPVMLLQHGLLMALTPVVAQLNGARRQGEIPLQLHQGMWIALLSSLPAMLALYLADRLLLWRGVDGSLLELTRLYLHSVLWGVPGFALFQLLRNFSDGMSHTQPSMVVGFIGLLINIPANFLFIHGHLGLPPMGGAGCGVATAIVFWGMSLTMLVLQRRTPYVKQLRPWKRLTAPRWPAIRHLLGIGVPIALAIFFEVTQFSVVAFLLAPLGEKIVAGHQAIFNYSSLVFMLPLSISMAVTIRVGHCLGEGDPRQAQTSCYVGFSLAILSVLLSASLTLWGKDSIVRLYTADPAVMRIATSLMLFAAAYQLSDALQVVAAGALRGYKDTRAIFFITLVAYWCLGLPSGYLLGLTDWLVKPMGPQGFWLGFLIGLSAAALMLIIRLRAIYHQVATVHPAPAI